MVWMAFYQEGGFCYTQLGPSGQAYSIFGFPLLLGKYTIFDSA